MPCEPNTFSQKLKLVGQSGTTALIRRYGNKEIRDEQTRRSPK
jgi:hypothetical protein